MDTKNHLDNNRHLIGGIVQFNCCLIGIKYDYKLLRIRQYLQVILDNGDEKFIYLDVDEFDRS